MAAFILPAMLESKGNRPAHNTRCLGSHTPLSGNFSLSWSHLEGLRMVSVLRVAYL